MSGWPRLYTNHDVNSSAMSRVANLLACVALYCVSFSVDCGKLDVQAFLNGSFSVSVGGRQWFRSGSIGVRDLGKWWSQEDNSIQMTGSSEISGVDNIGKFTGYQYEWKAVGGASSLSFMTFISVYEDMQAVAFTIVFLDKATNTNISNYVNQTLSTFPAFVIEEGSVERGYVTWSGNSKCAGADHIDHIGAFLLNIFRSCQVCTKDITVNIVTTPPF